MSLLGYILTEKNIPVSLENRSNSAVGLVERLPGHGLAGLAEVHYSKMSWLIFVGFEGSVQVIAGKIPLLKTCL